MKKWKEINNQEIEKIAENCRSHWNLDSSPISNLVQTLEENGIVVSRIPLSHEIDAFSKFHENIPFITLGNSKQSSVRSRFDAAHELGHILLHREVKEKDLIDKQNLKIIESQANYFAGAFLFPKTAFLREFISLDLDLLIRMKSRWLVSMQSIAMRAGDLGLITENNKITFFRNMKMKNYKIIEPLDMEIPKENPSLLKTAIETIQKENNTYSNFLIESSINEKIIKELIINAG